MIFFTSLIYAGQSAEQPQTTQQSPSQESDQATSAPLTTTEIKENHNVTSFHISVGEEISLLLPSPISRPTLKRSHSFSEGQYRAWIHLSFGIKRESTSISSHSAPSSPVRTSDRSVKTPPPSPDLGTILSSPTQNSTIYGSFGTEPWG